MLEAISSDPGVQTTVIICTAALIGLAMILGFVLYQSRSHRP